MSSEIQGASSLEASEQACDEDRPGNSSDNSSSNSSSIDGLHIIAPGPQLYNNLSTSLSSPATVSANTSAKTLAKVPINLGERISRNDIVENIAATSFLSIPLNLFLRTSGPESSPLENAYPVPRYPVSPLQVTSTGINRVAYHASMDHKTTHVVVDHAIIEKLLLFTLKAFGLEHYGLSVEFASPGDMASFNNKWRAKNAVTDVLSFPQLSFPRGLELPGSASANEEHHHTSSSSSGLSSPHGTHRGTDPCRADPCCAKDSTTYLSSEMTEVPQHLGDILLCPEYIAQLCKTHPRGTPPQHFQWTLIHGLLHLLGHDHLRSEEAEIMLALEKQLANMWSSNHPSLTSQAIKMECPL